MLEMKLVILVTTLTMATSAADQGQSKFPFCKFATCQMNGTSGRQMADVVSTTQHRMHILDDNYWLWTNQTDNSTHPYAYRSVTFQNNNFINLTYVFPVSNLTYLNLAFNDIYRLGTAVFQNLQDMQVLILSNNDLEIIDPDAFKGLYKEHELLPLGSLKELRLDHNRLHSLNQDLFEHTTHIELLDLSNNPLEVMDSHTVSAIDTLVLLKKLYLQYTGIKTLPDNLLHTPKYMEVLDLSGNPISVFPKTLEQAKNLNSLYLNNTGFVNITSENGFPELPNLKVLHLCRNQYLGRLEAHSLSGLTALEDLRLCDNIDLVYVDPFALAKIQNNSGGAIWPHIKKLYIGNNKLAYLDSDLLARWDGLSELDIRHNPWTCECENQWLIDDLMPIYMKIEPSMAMEVVCAAPVEMERYSFHELYAKKSNMRCLDAYDAHPENDAAMLVGVLAGVLIAIPTILLLILAYQRKWINICGCCDNSPASYSRRYYSASAADENF